MDFRHLEYIVTIAEEQKISFACERLFVSQPALSQHLIKLEKELGVALFERKNNTMLLTKAGELYVNAARQILDIKKQTYKEIGALSESSTGRFSVGLTPGRFIRIMPEVFSAFHEDYPQFRVDFIENPLAELERQLDRRKIDLLLGISSECGLPAAKNFTESLLLTEEIVLAVPVRHKLAKLAENRSRPFVLEDLSVLNGEEIATTDKSSRFRNMTDTYLARVGVRPDIIYECQDAFVMHRVTKQKECLSLIPDTYVREDKDIFTFSLSPRLYWNLSVFTRSDSYLSKAEKHFIEICREQIHILNKSIATKSAQ